MYRLIVVFLGFLINGCTPLELLNATVSHDGYQKTLNHAYGESLRQTLDIYIPETIISNGDVVVFFYGGRWQDGSKKDYAFVADAYTSKGIITVIADYRIYPGVDWRDFIRDGEKAYQWVFKNINQFGGDPKRIFIMGHSAGAHISAMVAVNAVQIENQENESINQNRPCGLMGLAGPYDFLPISDIDVKRVFASAENLENTQPINFVTQDTPAMLLMHGLADTTVKPGNTTRMATRVKSVNGRVQVKLYEKVDHIDILISLSSTFRDYSPALNDSVDFIQNTLCE